MEVNNEGQLEAESQQMEMKPIGKEQLKKFTKILREYKAGKARTRPGKPERRPASLRQSSGGSCETPQRNRKRRRLAQMAALPLSPPGCTMWSPASTPMPLSSTRSRISFQGKKETRRRRSC